VSSPAFMTQTVTLVGMRRARVAGGLPGGGGDLCGERGQDLRWYRKETPRKSLVLGLLALSPTGVQSTGQGGCLPDAGSDHKARERGMVDPNGVF
jgi:hypothetical protein